jgi:hypothetical protein
MQKPGQISVMETPPRVKPYAWARYRGRLLRCSIGLKSAASHSVDKRWPEQGPAVPPERCCQPAQTGILIPMSTETRSREDQNNAIQESF